MWTRFYPILTPHPLEWTKMDILHIIYPLSRDPPPPSTCPRSYGMAPKFKKRPLTSAKFYKRVMISAPSKIYPPSRNFHSFIATLCSVKKNERKFIRLKPTLFPKPLMRKVRTSRRHLLAEKRAIHGTWYN